MQTKLDITCNPKEWTDLDQIDKFALELEANLDPVFFWHHPKMGNASLWPSQQELLREFYKKDAEGRRKYKELLFAAGMRGGKTASAALIILTELAYMLMMASPQKKFDLLPKEEILFLMTASTEQQAIDTIFKKVIAFIESSPYFCSFDKEWGGLGIALTAGRIEFPKNLVCLALGSNLKANVGRTVKVFVAEEINFTGTESWKVSPKVLYNRLSKSTSTFKPFGEDIKVAISSMADGSDFLSKRIKLTRQQKMDAESGGTTLILQKTTLELNPNIKKEHLSDEFTMDEEAANQDYGIAAARDGSSWFKKISMDKIRAWNRPNIFVGEEPEPFKVEMYIPDLDITKLEYDLEAESYVIMTDPASVGDGFGFLVGHKTVTDKLIIDGLTVIKAGRDQEIDPRIIQRMLEKIITKVPVEVYGFDIYMYNELRQKAYELGILTYQHMINIVDWEAVKERINTNRLEGPFSEYLIAEMGGLRVHNGKIDHQNGGSKDMADTIAQFVGYYDNRDKNKEKGGEEEAQPILMERAI